MARAANGEITGACCAIPADGTPWTYGYNGYGQVGLGNTLSQPTPAQVGTGTTWQSVTAGTYSVLAIKTDGTLWAWGNNQYSQLGNGNGNTTNQLSPVQIGAGASWQHVAAGNVYSATIRTDGTLWNWGLNRNGQLGISSIANPIPLYITTGGTTLATTAANSLAA